MTPQHATAHGTVVLITPHALNADIDRAWANFHGEFLYNHPCRQLELRLLASPEDPRYLDVLVAAQRLRRDIINAGARDEQILLQRQAH